MIRVLLYSDMPVVAAGLRSTLAETGAYDLRVVSGSTRELSEAARSIDPHVVLLDMTADYPPDLLGQLDPVLLERRLVLWVYEVAPEMVFEAMAMGVRGILRSTLPADLALRCLEKVQQGELWFEKDLVDEFSDARRAGLTGREVQLVRLLALGLKNKEIADTLSITEGTVKVYLSRLFQKLGVKDRFELALYGMRHPGAGAYRSPRPALARRGRRFRPQQPPRA